MHGVADVVADFGADPTAQRTSHVEIQRALDDPTVQELLFPSQPIAAVGKAVYDLRERLVINRPVKLRGIGPGGVYPSAVLACEPGVAGILVDGGATGTVIEDLGIVGLDLTSSTICHGIEALTRIHTRRLRIETFTGNGLYIHASTPYGASLSSDEDSVIESCNGDGFYIHGNDANAGRFMGTSSNNNKCAGFRDESFLGNNYYSPHTENNQGPAYHIGAGPSQAVLFAVYAEGGQGKCYFGPTVIVYGLQSGTDWEGGQVYGAGGSTALFANCVLNTPSAYFRGWTSDRSTPPLVVGEQNGHRNFAVWDDGAFGEPLGLVPRPKWSSLIRRFTDNPSSPDYQYYAYFGLADALTGYAAGPAILTGRSVGPRLSDGVLEFLSQSDRAGGVVGYFPALSLRDGRIYGGDNGFVPTRVTSVQRDSLPTPLDDGLTVWNTDTGRLNCWSQARSRWEDGASNVV